MQTKAEVGVVFIGDIAFNTNITPQKQKTTIGGAAYFCAVGALAANQREQVPINHGVVAPVGEDFNLDFLNEHKVDTRGVPVVPGQKTCSFVAVQHPDNSRDFSATRNVAEEVDTSFFPHDYKSAEFIHLSTSLPQNYLIWLGFLRDNGLQAQVSADAFETFAQQFPCETIEALNQSDMIFINEAEADILAHYGSLRTDIPWVFKKGPGGVSYLEKSREIRVPAPQVKAVETSGAGDTLAGAFLTLLSHDYDIEHALQVAVGIASESVTQFGVEHLLT